MLQENKTGEMDEKSNNTSLHIDYHDESDFLPKNSHFKASTCLLMNNCKM